MNTTEPQPDPSPAQQCPVCAWCSKPIEPGTYHETSREYPRQCEVFDAQPIATAGEPKGGPVDLKSQLRENAYTRIRVMGTAKDRQQFDEEFDLFWAQVEVHFAQSAPSPASTEREEIQRWEFTDHSSGMQYWHTMERNGDGDYSLFSDHQLARAQDKARIAAYDKAFTQVCMAMKGRKTLTSIANGLDRIADIMEALTAELNRNTEK